MPNGLAMHRDFLRLIINNIDMKKQILKIIENRMKNISESDVISHNCYADLYNEIEALDEVKNNGVLAVVSGSSSRHPKCKGWYKNDWGMMDGADWGCDYDTTIDCDECKYGGGIKDPEAKRNQNYR